MGHVDHAQNNQRPDWPQADARVLGQILAAQNVVFALPDTTRIAEFYAQTLISVPGITACRVCLGGQSVQAGEMASSRCAECETLRRLAREDETLIPASSDFRCTLADRPDTRVIPIDSYQHHFGFFVTQIENAAIFEAYHPFISNLSNYVAIILENRLQKNLLQQAHDELESRVKERTRDLTAANEALDASRLAALNIMHESIEARQRAEQANVDLQREVAERKRAEQNIALMNFALNNVHEAAFLIDEQARFHFVNEESCRILGYSHAELLGLSVPDVDPDFPIDRWRNHWSNLKAQRSLIFEGRHRAKDGRIFPVEVNTNYFEYGGRAYNLALVRDITARKRAEEALRESEQKFRSFVEESSEGITLVDEQGAIIEWNHAREKITGLLASQVIGQKLWDVLHQMLQPELQTPERYERNKQPILSALQTGKSPLFANVLEAEVVRQNGERQFIQQTIFPIKTDKGYRMGSVTRDITERIRAIGALRESEAKFSTSFRYSPSALSVSTAKDHVYVDVNDRFLLWTGYTPAEVLGHTSIELKLWAEPDQDREFRRLLHEHGSVYNFEYTYRRKDGDVRYALVSATFITIGGERCVLAQSNDITDRKQAEEALWESSQMLKLVLDNMPAFVFWKDRISVYLGCNYLFASNAGLSSPQAIIGLTDLDLPWKSTEAESYRADDRLVMETGIPKLNYEETQLTADGRATNVRTSKIPLRNPAGDVIGVLGTFEDITDRKRAEARILRLNRLYATLSQINQTIVHVRDREKLFLEICRVAIEHGQFRLAWISLVDEATARVEPVAFAGEEQGYLTAITITSQDEPSGRGPTGMAVREGRCVLCQDIATDVSMLPWRDQALQRGYRSSAAVPFRQHGRVIGALTVFAAEPQGFDAEDEQLLDEISQDISFALDALEQEAQRRQAEAELSQLNVELEQRVIVRTAELARAHEHLRAILDTAGEGVVFTNPQGLIEYINPAMERLTGYLATEVIGRNPRVWKSDQTPAATHRHMWSALTGGEIWRGELINRRKDGTLYDAALTTAPLTNPEGQTVGFVGVQRNITHQKELDRMKDQFVSNVSHELRTPLANILLHIGLLEHGKPDKLASYLQTLRREAERLRKLIEDLLDLSRLDRNVAAIQLLPIDLNQLLEQLVTDRAALAEQRGLMLTYEPVPDLPLVLTDTSKLIQVASNLMTNALNYTPMGGTVSVWAEVRQHEGQKMAAFTVRDTGPGISAQDVPHLFERFYRGAAGRQASAPGTGLGLAISQEIMRRLGGHITLESEAGRGAAFTVWLPIASAVSTDH